MILPLISLDTETTGLDPERHAPWELGYLTAVHNRQHKTVTVLHARAFNLQLPTKTQFDPVALRIGGFIERYAATGARPRVPWWLVQNQLDRDLEQLRTFAVEDLTSIDPSADVIKLAPTHLVGAVPQFDHRMLERWLGWDHRRWHYHHIDVETLCAGKYQLPYPLSTDVLTERVLPGWDTSRKHQALADARWALHLYAAAYDATVLDEHITYPDTHQEDPDAPEHDRPAD